MGIANAHGPGIYNSPKFGPSQSWSMKSNSEISALAKRFLALMADKPYGPYHATRLIFGTAAADHLGRDSASGSAQYACPPSAQITVPKRRLPVDLPSDGEFDSPDADDAIAEHSTSKRRRR